MDKGDSILYRTHQSWKLTVAAGGMLIGAALVTLALTRLNLATAPDYGHLSMAGVLVLLFSFAYPLAAIRCPSCGARWLWLATMQRETNWRKWLLARGSCPKCRSSFSTAAT